MTKEELYEKAVDAYAEGQLDESVALYRQALEVDPHYIDVLHGLARALQDLGRLEEAEKAAKRLIEIDNDDVLAHTRLSMIYHDQGRIEDAEKEGNVAKIMGWKEELKKGKNS
jgi:tetratricopeptide (TPR) repeat protein